MNLLRKQKQTQSLKSGNFSESDFLGVTLRIRGVYVAEWNSGRNLSKVLAGDQLQLDGMESSGV